MPQATNTVLHDRRYYVDKVCEAPKRLDPDTLELCESEDEDELPPVRATNAALHDKRYYEKIVCEAPKPIAKVPNPKLAPVVSTEDVRDLRITLRDADRDQGKKVRLNLQWQRKPCAKLVEVLGCDEPCALKVVLGDSLRMDDRMGAVLRDGDVVELTRKTPEEILADASDAPVVEDVSAGLARRAALEARAAEDDAKRAAAAEAREAGNAAFKDGQLERAHALYAQATLLDATDARSWANLAAIALRWDDPAAAERAAAMAGEHAEPGDPVGKWRFRLGRAKHGRRDYDGALACFDDALQSPDFAEGSALLRDLRNAKKRAEAAIAKLRVSDEPN